MGRTASTTAARQRLRGRPENIDGQIAPQTDTLERCPLYMNHTPVNPGRKIIDVSVRQLQRLRPTAFGGAAKH